MFVPVLYLEAYRREPKSIKRRRRANFGNGDDDEAGKQDHLKFWRTRQQVTTSHRIEKASEGIEALVENNTSVASISPSAHAPVVPF
ncbi:hypothetical protein CANMA_000795 [Candida margitis]|uniref:uncharacterized protein n=1 Tax=Candida margitis TaxID=1775924 RepID=UPI002226B3DE|nr:uncharacterized protein CANMA_000795 [Candida margitis]KAI5970184.1 hypothetical protein CANMA_000795 [Candida margitis]